jgi:hypothetical protein
LSDTLKSSRDVGVLPFAVSDPINPLRGLGNTSVLVSQDITEERDLKVGAALLAWHLRAGRASIELLGGVGLVNERVTVITELRVPPVPVRGLTVPPFRTEYTTSAHHPVAMVGADAAVALTSHASLVPQVRAYALNGALQVRPGLGLRWTF